MRWIPAAIVATALLLTVAATGCDDGDDADAAATDAGDTAGIVVSGEAPFTIPDKSQAVVDGLLERGPDAGRGAV